MPSINIQSAKVTISVENTWEEEGHALVLELRNASINYVTEDGTWASVTIDGDPSDAHEEM
jgi:hypothetical protein